MAKKIIQIMPATGWYATYKDDAELIYNPLVCWALVEADGERFISGMDDGSPIDFCEEVGNFAGYAHETEKAAKLHNA